MDLPWSEGGKQLSVSFLSTSPLILLGQLLVVNIDRAMFTTMAVAQSKQSIHKCHMSPAGHAIRRYVKLIR